MQRHLVRFLTTVITAALCLIAVGVGAIAATVKIRGGEWRMPAKQDIEALVVIIEAKPEPAHTIYLERDAMTVRYGVDDASRATSSLVAPGPARTIPKYRASNKNWKRLMACVEDKFQGMNVEFTDVKPAGNDYVIVKVGGKQRDIGKEGKAIGGIAPFNGEPLNNVIVYAFDQGGKYRTRTNCETIAHEVGHIYGLDHSYECHDIMSYLQGCGKKRFMARALPCGEHSVRDCVAKRPSQNSRDYLLSVLGAVGKED